MSPVQWANYERCLTMGEKSFVDNIEDDRCTREIRLGEGIKKDVYNFAMKYEQASFFLFLFFCLRQKEKRSLRETLSVD